VGARCREYGGEARWGCASLPRGRAASGAARQCRRVGLRRRACEQRAGRRDRPGMRGGASAATALQTAAGGGRGWRSRRGLPGDAAEAGQQADKIPRRYETDKSRLKPTTEPMKPKPRSSVSHFLCNRSVVTFSKTEVFPDRITKPNYRFKPNAQPEKRLSAPSPGQL